MKPPFLSLFAGFLIGVIWSEYDTFSSSTSIAFCSLLVLASALLYRFVSYAQTLFVRCVFIFLLFCTVGIIRTEIASPSAIPLYVSPVSTTTTLVVTSIPETHKGSISFGAAFHDGHTTSMNASQIRVTTDLYTQFVYGDVLLVSGVLQPITLNRKTPDYLIEKLQREGILYEIVFPEIEVRNHGMGNTFMTLVSDIRSWIQNTIQVFMREPTSGLMSGLLIGDKQGISKEWYDMFTSVGLTHIIVLSGYNLAILYALLRGLTRRAPLLIQHAVAMAAVVMLIIVSGAEAPAIRAGILLFTITLAELLGRQQNTGYFLSLVVLLMILVDPAYLLHDVSFQLSVAATYGLVYLAPHIFLPRRVPSFLKTIIKETTAAQIAVIPLVLFYFGTLSWISFVVNILVLPMIPILMVFGLTTLLVSIVGIVGELSGAIAHVLSSYVFFIVEFFASVTSPLLIPTDLFSLLGMYAMILMWVITQQRKQKL